MTLERGPKGRTLRIAAVAVVGLAALAAAAKAQNVGVFVSSETTDGSIDEPSFATGLDSADAICDRLGTAAIPGSGPWVAWLSTGDPPANARDRIPEPGAGGAYVRASQPGTVIADDLADLTDSSLTASILITEAGGASVLDVWTGTNAAGEIFDPLETCADWTLTGGQTDAGRVGDGFATDSGWTEAFQLLCSDDDTAIYCFGPLTPPAPALPPPALLALAVLLLAGGAYLYRRRQAHG